MVYAPGGHIEPFSPTSPALSERTERLGLPLTVAEFSSWLVTEGKMERGDAGRAERACLRAERSALGDSHAARGRERVEEARARREAIRLAREGCRVQKQLLGCKGKAEAEYYAAELRSQRDAWRERARSIADEECGAAQASRILINRLGVAERNQAFADEGRVQSAQASELIEVRARDRAEMARQRHELVSEETSEQAHEATRSLVDQAAAAAGRAGRDAVGALRCARAHNAAVFDEKQARTREDVYRTAERSRQRQADRFAEKQELGEANREEARWRSAERAAAEEHALHVRRANHDAVRWGKFVSLEVEDFVRLR